MLNAIARLIAGVTLATLVACGNGGAVTNVSIDGGDRTIVLGDSPTLTATVAATGNASTTVSWTSSDETVATIAADGQVTSHTDGTTAITATSTVDPTKNDAITLTINPPGALRWTRQFGTSGSDVGRGIANDASGNVYVTGSTEGGLEGSSAGGLDAFVRSYDSNGNHRWTRQFGSSSDDVAFGIANDASGNVYTTGSTEGGLEGSSAGGLDAFVRSYDSNGNLRWTRQFGSSSDDVAFGIASDANGHVYTTGYTLGSLEGSSAGGWDAFVRSYDSNGDLRWTRQFGTSSTDFARGIVVDVGGNVYIAGYTAGALEGSSAGGVDAFVRSYDSSGNVRWTRQFGTSSTDDASGIASDASGHVYVSGSTQGALEGSNAGIFDAFVRSYDSDGNVRWTRQFGTSGGDLARGIVVDASDNVYATGNTAGALEGSNAGNDAFIRSYGR